MKVAAAQFCPLFKDPKANIGLMEVMASEAAQNKAAVIVFPEMATAGYSFMSQEEAKPFSEDPGNGPSMQAMQEASSSLGIAIAWGFIERGDDGEFYNSQALVLPSKSLTICRKMNLWGNDHLWATGSRLSPPVVKYKGKRIGLLICRDIRDKSDNDPDLYEKGDADFILFSANFGKGAFPANAWMSFVKDNEIPLVVSNRYGQESNNDFGLGGICIIRPHGKVECKGLEWGVPCMVYADL